MNTGASSESIPSTTESSPRQYLPLYRSQGDAAADRLAFFHILQRLKTQKRTGWVDHGIPDAESISDHMYRMAVMAMCSSDVSLDMPRCVMLAVVHDLAEAQVGDIAPREGIPKAEKRRLEKEAMENFVNEMLHGSAAAQRIMTLWEEYEMQETPEARFVKDLDRLEMAVQATEYERSSGKNLQQFFDSSIPSLRHSEVVSWGQDLVNERANMQSATRPV